MTTRKRKRVFSQPPRKRRRRFPTTRRIPPSLHFETKFKDTAVDDAAIATTGTVQLGVITIAEGTDDDQRVGRRIVLKKLQWRYTLTIIQTIDGNNTSDVVRMMVLLDKQCNGAIPIVSGASGILTADTFDSFMQLANSGRFEVLMNRYHNMNNTAGVGDGTTNEYGENSKFFQWHKEVSIPVEYDISVTTGAIESIRSNNIVVITWSEGANCKMVSLFRVRYSDH